MKTYFGFLKFFIIFFFFTFFFLGLPVWHMEVSRLGVKLELQLLAYTTATATPDLSRICHLHHSLNPLGKARDRIYIFMDISPVLNPLSHNGSFSFWGINIKILDISLKILRGKLSLLSKSLRSQPLNLSVFLHDLCSQGHIDVYIS